MSSESTTEAGRSLWDLPEVIRLKAERMQYSPPQQRLSGLDIVDVTEAVEIEVEVGFEFPARALSPALYVGDQELTHYKIAGPTAYRFVAFDFQRLAPQAPIALGWPGYPETRIETRFRYELGEPPVS